MGLRPQAVVLDSSQPRFRSNKKGQRIRPLPPQALKMNLQVRARIGMRRQTSAG